MSRTDFIILPYGALLVLASGDEATRNNLAQHDGRV
jgi:hypothetical protein